MINDQKYLNEIFFLQIIFFPLSKDCPEGRLTPQAFLIIYSKCFPKMNAKKFCEHVFRTFDTDKNGFIDFKEFLLAVDVTSGGSAEKKLSWAFRSVISIFFKGINFLYIS